MANCTPGECSGDPTYKTPVVLRPLPGGGEGGGHEFVTELPDTGTPGVEYIVMGDPRDCSSFKGSYVWNNDCWVATSGAGGGSLDTYTFEKTTTGWIAKKNGKVIFTYNDERITQNQTDITNIKNDIYNNYLVDRISVCDGGPLTLTVDDTDPKKKKIKLCLNGDLGDKSDGAYEIKGTLSTYLSTAILGTTPVNVANVPSLNPNDIVIGETYLYDHQGTMGKVTAYDKTTGIMTVQTMTTSPGERAGVRLGAVETKPDLPATITAAEGMGWLTPIEGDFAYVRQDGPNGDKLGEWLVQSIDAAGNITWAFSHYINAGNYVVDVLLSDGTLIPKNPDGTVTLPNYVRTVELHDGTVLPVDANGKVKLPDFGMLKGVRTSDGTLLTIAADGTVTLPAIPKKFDTYKIETSYKDWLNVKTDIDKVMTIDPAKLVGITKEGAAMTVANFATDVLPNRDLVYVHGVDGTNETQEAIAWFDSYNATTGIKLRILAIPRGGGGGGGAADKEVPEYTRDLHAGDIINHLELITYDNILYRMIDTAPYTLTGNWATDKTHFEVINSEAKNTYYNLSNDGQMLASWAGSYAEQAPQPLSRSVNVKVVEYSHGGPADVISFNPTTSIWTFRGGDKGRRFEVIANLATLGQAAHADAAVNGVQVYANWYLAGTTTPVTNSFGQFNNPGEAAGYGGGSGSAFQFDVPAGAEIKIQPALTAYTTDSGKKVWMRSGASNIVIKEIGRIVDPIAYMLDDGKAEDSPVGNIISYMGNNVPAHYLACDGSAYAIGTYPELEAHFLKEFGSITYFGAGAAANTYKVPDLRGEFLRGTGTNSHTNPQTTTKEGSGAAVGAHQGATALRNIWHYDSTSNDNQAIWYSNNANGVDSNLLAAGIDTSGPRSTHSRSISQLQPIYQNDTNFVYGTTRPTNTSVKYCIKYETVPRVVVESALYRAKADWTCAGTHKDGIPINLTFSNAEDDVSMFTASAMVAPVDGYYNISIIAPENGTTNQGLQLGFTGYYVYVNGQLVAGQRNRVGTTGTATPYDDRLGLDETTQMKLKKGDKVTFQLYIPKADGTAQTTNIKGTATIVLLNTLDNVAETMLKPNTWAVGVEQNFGDGVYGMRLKGTTPSYTSNTNGQRHTFKIGSFPASTRFLQQGGCALVSGDWIWSMGMAWGNTSGDGRMNYALAAYLNVTGKSGSTMADYNIDIQNSTASSGDQYDLWVLYER